MISLGDLLVVGVAVILGAGAVTWATRRQRVTSPMDTAPLSTMSISDALEDDELQGTPPEPPARRSTLVPRRIGRRQR